MNIESSIYPFQGAYFDRGGVKLHYLDEGEGEPVVMVHGNPSWSIYYRNLVTALSGEYRCIVPDHIGCGFSDKPGDDQYDYTLGERVADLTALLEHLGATEKITLVVHDWGGMIGMLYAVRHPERIKQIVVLNTSAFHLPESKKFPLPLWLCRTPLGAFLIRGFNAFSGTAAKVCCTRNPMTPELKKAYCAPYDSWANRIATLRFVQDIPLKKSDRTYDLVSEVEGNVQQFSNTPILVCWGLTDFVFDKHFLAKWQETFPTAEVHAFEDGGHYVLEDCADEVIPLIESFMERNR